MIGDQGLRLGWGGGWVGRGWEREFEGVNGGKKEHI